MNSFKGEVQFKLKELRSKSNPFGIASDYDMRNKIELIKG